MTAHGTPATADETGPATGAGAAHTRAAAASPDPVDPAPRRSLVDRAKALFAWWQHTRPARANARFGARGGGVLTGGIAYAALFSVFAALTIGYTVFMSVLGGDDQLRETVLESVDTSLPGLIKTGDGSGGMIDPDDLVLDKGLTVTGIVAVAVLLFSAIAAMAALRTAIRAMFAAEGGGNAVLGKARELGGFVGMALAVLLSALVTTGVASTATWILDSLGWGSSATVVLRALAILVTFVIDAAIFLLLVRVLADQAPPWRELRRGAIIAGVGIGVVRLLGTEVVAASVSRNPLFGSVAVIVTLLVWINLIARIVLLAAAWTADPPLADESMPAEGPAAA